MPTTVEANSKSRAAAALYALMLFATFCIYSFCKRNLIHDEVTHVPVVIDFGRMFAGEKAWTLDYNNSLGPVFYSFYSLFRLVNKSLLITRLPSFLFTVANITLIYRCLRPAGSSFGACMAVYLSGPWSCLSAFTVHGEQMACFTTLVAMICLCKEPDSQRTIGNSVTGCAALALTPMVRIYSVFIFPAIAGLALANRQYRKLIPYIAAAVVPSCIVFWIWKGITPPAFSAVEGAGGQRLMLNASYLKRPLMMASTLGIYLWPWFFSIPKSVLPKFKLAVLLLVGCLLAGFITPLGVAGPLDSLMRKVLHLGPLPIPFWSLSDRMMAVRPIYGLGLFVLCAAGLACFRQAWAGRDQISAVCALGLLCYGLSLPFTGVLFVERYFFPGYVLCVVTLLRNFEIKAGTMYSYFPLLAMGLAHAFAK
jgi:hypothetical protein